MSSRVICLPIIIVLTILGVGPAVAQFGVPRMINCQGILTDDTGTPLSGPVQVIFAIWDDPAAGDSLWSEMREINPDGPGRFDVLLGLDSPIPDSAFGEGAFLSIQVVGFSEMAPRQHLVSVAYAYKAGLANEAIVSVHAAPMSVNSEAIIDGAIELQDFGDNGAGEGQIIKRGPGGWVIADDATGGEPIPDEDWVLDSDVLSTVGKWGIARAGNILFGDNDSTHVNLGVACTTGVAGQNHAYCTIGGGLKNRAAAQFAGVSFGTGNEALGERSTIGGGRVNRAYGTSSVVAGGEQNWALGEWATVTGGFGNLADAYMSTAGGHYNHAGGNWSTATGGGANAASGEYGAILGGNHNSASGSYSSILGGYADTVLATYACVVSGWNNIAGDEPEDTAAFVGGGRQNKAIHQFAAVVGGESNQAGGRAAIVGGGANNRAEGKYSVVAGGGGDLLSDSNSALGDWSVIGGGYRNIAEKDHSVVGGGRDNSSTGTESVVDGGRGNQAMGGQSFIGGGWFNEAHDGEVTIGGGSYNIAHSRYSTISGGNANETDAPIGLHACAVVGGGSQNKAMHQFATVAGGGYNQATGFRSTIGGGMHNRADDTASVVCGGGNNYARGRYSAIVGGGGEYTSTDSNAALGDWSFVGGGSRNVAAGNLATVVGGEGNFARGSHSFVGGGGGGAVSDSNSALGDWSVVPGGRRNIAVGQYSFAAGYRAQAKHFGSWVWADGTDADFASTDNNQFLIRAAGGVGIGTNAPEVGYQLHVNGLARFNIASGSIAMSTPGGWPGFIMLSPGNNRRDLIIKDNSLHLVTSNSNAAPSASNGITILNDGSVGIGTDAPNYTLDVRGTIGNNTVTYHSDLRWKTNIETIPNALEKVSALRGVNFEWRREDYGEMNFPAGRHLGVIAQEIETVLPELVHTTSDGYKSVEYANLTALLIEAVKEQQQTIRSLETQITDIRTLLEQQSGER